jgi:murein L,D-transpeptidase YcbB/YkuD
MKNIFVNAKTNKVINLEKCWGRIHMSVWLLLLPLLMQEGTAWAEGTVNTEIQSLLKAGRLPELHASAFADVGKTLTLLYSENADPLWLSQGYPTAQAREMVTNLAQADDQGLYAADYDAELLKKWLDSPELQAGDAQAEAKFDVALSIATARYATHLHQGRINPKSVGFALEVGPRKIDVPKSVREISQSVNPGDSLAGLEPQFPMYRPLKDGLRRYRQLAGELPKLSFAFPAKFTPGMSHKDVPHLRKLLVALGDLRAVDPATETLDVYDPALAEAVKIFQIRHGLGNDGVIGKKTLARLSTPIGKRIEQIEIGLERLRWLPDVRGSYLIVNIPSFKLYGAKTGDGPGSYDIEMNVIVGESIDGHGTPVFHSDMSMVTFRPYWNVPPSIAEKELAPIIKRNPAYLTKHNMEMVGNGHGGLRIRQKPGPKNALGKIKFSFPNTNNVYLHGTPNQGLFKLDRRDFSHGCIRVEDPPKLAEWVLQDQGNWHMERIQKAITGPDNQTVSLKNTIPVYILYSTVIADPDGTISFYDDIYGHDKTLQTLLSKGLSAPAAQE